MPQLIFHVEKEYPKIRDLEADKILIGRSGENSILLNDSSVSAHHAELRKDDDGSYLVHNLNSQNGTIVNGDRIEKSLRLSDGDKIRFGSVKAVYLDSQIGAKPESEEDNPQGLKSLIRKGEIERNNLRLLKNDSKWVRMEIEKSLKVKEKLETEVHQLNKEVDTAESDLSDHRKECSELKAVITEAREFKAEFKDLEKERDSRKATCEELSKKIAAGEKLYGDLDLENSIKQKDKLSRDMERLTKEIETSRVELKENKRAAEEASSVFNEAKMIEAGIGDKKAELKKWQEDCEQIENKISERSNNLEELEKKITDRSEEFGRLKESIESKGKEFRELIEGKENELKELVASKEMELKELIDGKEQELKDLIDNRVEELKELDKAVANNEGLIQAASVRLEEVEASVKQGIDKIAQTEDAHKSLEKQGVALNRTVAEKSAVLAFLKEKIKSRATTEIVCPPIRLVNPGMSSLVHYFNHGAASPDEEKHDPIGYHAFAACTRGSMHRDADSILSGEDPVLLLLTGDLNNDRALIDSIALAPGQILLVSWEDGKAKGVMDQSGGDFGNFLEGVTGIITTDSETNDLFKNSNPGRPHLNLPIPCPVEFPEWDLSLPVPDRTGGVFVCGDGFDPGSRVHRARLELLNRLMQEMKTTVTFYQHEPQPIEGFDTGNESIKSCESPLKYTDYLRLVGQHLLVTGFGKNFAGNDVIGDAVLARSLFVGGDRESVEAQLLFPDTSISVDDYDSALENASRLLSNKDAYVDAMEQSQSLATQIISFESVRDRLGEFIQSLSG